MTYATLAAPRGVAQPHFSQPQKPAADRAEQLQALPEQWRQALLSIGRDKQPIDASGRCLNAWQRSPAPSTEQLLAAPAVGLRTGPISQTLAVDFDGPEAFTTFRELFGGTVREVLPRSIVWTSGRPHRAQAAFAIDAEGASILARKRRKVGALELRWHGQQSVLLGFHPITGAYRWVKGRAPWETELATFPAALLRRIPDSGSPPRQAPQAPAQASGQVARLVVPLEAFVSLRSRLLIGSGSAEGQCNSDGLALALDLVGAERWVKAQGGAVERSARALFADYLNRCPETINGKPFNWQAAAARFDGALKRNPQPQTPEAKLIERLDYHRRAAARAARQEVAA